MTSRVIDAVRCACGHEGAIITTESDSPHSDNWEKYSARDLRAGIFEVYRRTATWDEVFENIEPTCPACGARLTPANLV